MVIDRSIRYRYLDVLRGAAALSVLFSHWSGYSLPMIHRASILGGALDYYRICLNILSGPMVDCIPA